MEACAENNLPMVLLDRPDPNGFYVNEPVLDMKYSSFVGMYPIPVVYGMTIGELAMMINEEGWLKNHIRCNLKVIRCTGYTHNSRYSLPINPSPNLQCMEAVYLYPSVGLFEGTVCSVGRGNHFPFRVVGHPKYSDTLFYFIPKSISGITKDPKFENRKCYGLDLTKISKHDLQNKKNIDIQYLITFYNKYPNKKHFFTSFFNYMAGNSILKQQIENNISIEEIRASWKKDLEAFNVKRKKYLLYQDF